MATPSAPSRWRALARRGGQSILLLLIVLFLSFVMLALAPGDMADVTAAESGGGDSHYVEELRSRYGLDRPLYERYGRYVVHVAQLDLGISHRRNAPVASIIAQRLLPTALLVGTAIGIAFLLSLALGGFSALRPDHLLSRLIDRLALVANAAPSFLIAMVLTYIFALRLRWLPSAGYEVLLSPFHGVERLLDIGRHLALPAATLAFLHLGLYIRLIRTALTEAMAQDYIRTARAKGVGEGRIVLIHALRNALLPLTSIMGTQLAGILGGAVIVEQIFAWPGLGQLAFEAVTDRDVDLLLGIILVSGIAVITINIVVEGLQMWLDPRIRSR